MSIMDLYNLGMQGTNTQTLTLNSSMPSLRIRILPYIRCIHVDGERESDTVSRHPWILHRSSNTAQRPGTLGSGAGHGNLLFLSSGAGNWPRRVVLTCRVGGLCQWCQWCAGASFPPTSFPQAYSAAKYCMYFVRTHSPFWNAIYRNSRPIVVRIGSSGPMEHVHG